MPDVNQVTRPVKEALRRTGLRGGAVPEVRQVDAQPFVWRWWRQGGIGAWTAAEIALRLGPDRGDTRLRRNIAHPAHPTGPQEQRVAPEATPCRFGEGALVVALPGDGPALRQAAPGEQGRVP